MKTQQKMRVLISGHLPPPIGGIATFYQSLLNSSLSEQVDILFVQTSSQKRTLSKSGSFNLSNLFSAGKDCVRFLKSVIAFRPELSHIATSYGLSFLKHSVCVLLARLAGSKVILHPHCSYATLYASRSKGWQWFFRQIVYLTDGVVGLSNEWKKLEKAIPDSKVYSLPNAIDLMPFHEIGKRNLNKGREADSLDILYLGYLGQAKGSYDLVEAAKGSLQQGLNFFYDLVGDELTPGELQMLKQRASESCSDDHIRLHPPAFGSEKDDFLQKADVFIYPSYHEGMPIAIIEAMACALPIVATKVGGIPDLVKDGVNGLLVEPGHPEQLINALMRLHEDSELRYSLQKNSRQIAYETYDIENLVPKLLAIYKDVLSNGKEKAGRLKEAG